MNVINFPLPSGNLKKDTIDKRNISKEKRGVDHIFVVVLFILIAFGSMMVYSAGYPYALSHYGDGAYYLKRHLVFLILGVIAMVIFSKIHYNFYNKWAPAFYGVCTVLLIVVLFGGYSEGVAKRWLGIPGTPLSFQPSELMKVGIVLILAWYLQKYSGEAKKGFLYEIVIPGALLFLSCGLVLLEKHLSGTVIIALIGISVLFVCGKSIKKMLISYGSIAILGATVFLLTNSYALKRIESFFNPNADILSDKWQTTQGLYAIGSGGLFGVGYMNSRQKYSYVSEPQNDFIFTIWCEEMGYIGALLVIFLFLVLIWRGYVIAFHSPDIFSSLTAFGISSQLAIQAFLNIGVVTDLIPNTGISLPFFSYGGSSLFILLSEMGIIMSISRYSKHKNRRLI